MLTRVARERAGSGRVCRRGGFTFLELLVVMTMIALITAAVVPVYGAGMNALRKRSVKNELVGLIQYAQQQAVTESREYRILFDEEQKRYWAVRWVRAEEDEEMFEPVEEAWGQERELPHHLSFKKLPKEKDEASKLPYLAFYPSGSSGQAEIVVEDAGGRRQGFSIETTGALGKVKVEEGGSAGHPRVHST